MRTRQKCVATDTWRSLGCRTTPLEHWSRRKPTVEPRWAKQQTKKLLTELGWDTLQERRRKHKLIILYKIVNSLTPNYLSDLLPPLVGDNNPYSFKNANDIQSFRAYANLLTLSSLLLSEFGIAASRYKRCKYRDSFQSKKISNDQELIQSDPISCPQNQKGNN